MGKNENASWKRWPVLTLILFFAILLLPKPLTLYLESELLTSHLLPNPCWLTSVSTIPLLYTEVINGLFVTKSNILLSPACQFSQKCVLLLQIVPSFSKLSSLNHCDPTPPGLPFTALRGFLPLSILEIFVSFQSSFPQGRFLKCPYTPKNGYLQEAELQLTYLCPKEGELIIHRIQERKEVNNQIQSGQKYAWTSRKTGHETWKLPIMACPDVFSNWLSAFFSLIQAFFLHKGGNVEA